VTQTMKDNAIEAVEINGEIITQKNAERIHDLLTPEFLQQLREGTARVNLGYFVLA
jgi:hypothetical protein